MLTAACVPTKPCFERLRLDGSGMEFASEMLLKAVLLEQRIAEVGVTLRPDRRGPRTCAHGATAGGICATS